MTSADYLARAAQFGFAPLDQIKEALAKPDTIVLDVRTADEIAAGGKLPHPGWTQTNCTPSECAELSATPEAYVKDKNATVVVHCRSGRRASKAVEILTEKGYTGTIMNAGGFDDVVGLMPSSA